MWSVRKKNVRDRCLMIDLRTSGCGLIFISFALAWENFIALP